MRCSFCGYDLDPEVAESACGSCPLARGCHLVRCPRCGYKMPPEAGLVKWIRDLRQRIADRRLLASTGLDRDCTADTVSHKTDKGGGLIYETE